MVYQRETGHYSHVTWREIGSSSILTVRAPGHKLSRASSAWQKTARSSPVTSMSSASSPASRKRREGNGVADAAPHGGDVCEQPMARHHCGWWVWRPPCRPGPEISAPGCQNRHLGVGCDGVRAGTHAKHHYQTHHHLKLHRQAFLMAYNFANRLKTLNWGLSNPATRLLPL